MATCSVAILFGIGGGGGKYRHKKNHIHVHVTYMHERAKRASASETYRPIFSHMDYGAINDLVSDKTRNIEKIYDINYASERGKFSHFHILKLLFPSILCWYFWYLISETYIFSGLKLHLHTHAINAVPCYYLWYGVVYKRQYTDKTLTLRKSMYMRASGASELRKFSHFYILKLLFLSILCWYFRWLCRYKWHACRLTCTDKTLKKHYGGQPPPPPLATANGWQIA